MTLQSVRPISIGNVATELGIGLPLSLGDSRVRTLAGVPSGAISLGQLLGKSNIRATYNVTLSDPSFTETYEASFATLVSGEEFTPTGFEWRINNWFTFTLYGIQPQNRFTSITIGNATYLTASVTAATLNGNTRWVWPAAGALSAGTFPFTMK